ncbi:hypothetical protein ACOME3_008064 [Neoechinorhynchus agilis]
MNAQSHAAQEYDSTSSKGSEDHFSVTAPDDRKLSNARLALLFPDDEAAEFTKREAEFQRLSRVFIILMNVLTILYGIVLIAVGASMKCNINPRVGSHVVAEIKRWFVHNPTVVSNMLITFGVISVAQTLLELPLQFRRIKKLKFALGIIRIVDGLIEIILVAILFGATKNFNRETTLQYGATVIAAMIFCICMITQLAKMSLIFSIFSI